MILADTSVWIDHFRAPLPALVQIVEAQEMLMHPLVLGELAMGNIARRETVLTSLGELPTAPLLDVAFVMQMVDQGRLYGRGLGFIDASLLASARLADAALWTRDRRLAASAAMLGVALV